MGSIGVGFGFGVGEGPSTEVGFGFGKPFKEELAREGAACAFATASSCLFFTSNAAFFSCCFCKKKTQPSPRKMITKMVFLITKTRGTRFGQLRQRAFLRRTLFYSNHIRLVASSNAITLLTEPSKFCPHSGVAAGILFCVFANPVWLDARPPHNTASRL